MCRTLRAMRLAIERSSVRRLTLKATSGKRADTWTAPLLGANTAGPSSGAHAGSLSFSSRASYSPLRTSTRPERVSLVEVRRGEYEALEEKLKDPAWAPDEGPAVFAPKSGAVQVSARFPLVAFNVNLRTDDLSIAKRIARSVRHIDGGYRFVRAIGLELTGTGMVQVSMNLTDYPRTPIPRVLETIRSEAARYGTLVASAELVGPVPLGAIEEVVRHYLQIDDFSMTQIIEMNV